MKSSLVFVFLLYISVECSTIYQIDSFKQVSYGWTASLALVRGDAEYGDDVKTLQLDMYLQTEERFHFTITDPAVARWRVPSFTIADQTVSNTDIHHAKYEVSWDNMPFSIRITRKRDLMVLFDTGLLSSLVFQDQYLQLATKLGEDSAIYGLGEQISRMKLDYGIYTIWNRDSPTPERQNLYGSHPFYMQVRDGKAHGVFFHNSNGMDIVYNNVSGADTLTFKTTGGILSFYIFTGGTPEEVVRQYTTLVGRPYMPPYWSLGFHQCRWGYPNLSYVENVVKLYRQADIPLETMWTDADYMSGFKDFTYDPVNFPPQRVKEWVDQLHRNGQHYMLITDPGIANQTGYAPYDEGSQLDIWIKNRFGEPLVGSVWPGRTVWPDWFHPSTAGWWKSNIQRLHDMVPFDGLWIDMNEISNFCVGECGEAAPPKKKGFDAYYPPYRIHNGNKKKPDNLNVATIDPDAVHYNGTLEYNAHNLYGYMESWISAEALEDIRGERALVITRSTFAGGGSRSGHWTGDDTSSWRSMEMTIPDVLNNNMYGVPMVGADICGFNGDTEEQLCARWIQLGAFYPFSRDHSDRGASYQELYLWKSVAANAKKILRIRYTLLPYYYTLFYHVNQGTEGTVLRPLWFEFPNDDVALRVDKQMLVGKGLMITPVLVKGAVQVVGYFPTGARWFDFYTLEEMKEGGQVLLAAPLSHIPVHHRGGSVIPMQASAYVLRDARLNPFELRVAPDRTGASSGNLFLDDGESLDTKSAISYMSYTAVVQADGGIFKSVVERNDYGTDLRVEKVVVMGVQAEPNRVTVNDNITAYEYDQETKVLTVLLSATSVVSSFKVEWSV